MMLRNEERYNDPTADHVLAKEGAAEREKVLRRIKAGIHIARTTFDELGFEIQERIVLRDKQTGKIWR